MAKACAEVPGEIFSVAYGAIGDDALSADEAERRLRAIDRLADFAIEQHKGGTFVVDGSYYLLGYMQKAEVGYSPALGFRPKPGQKNVPRQVEYGAATTRLREFINKLALTDFDVLMSWEAREIFRDVYNEMTGKKTGVERTGKFRTTWPQNVEYSTTLMLETLLTMEKNEAVFRFQIGKNAHDASYIGRTMRACSFVDLKGLLTAGATDALALLDPVGAPIERVSTELLADDA